MASLKILRKVVEFFVKRCKFPRKQDSRSNVLCTSKDGALVTFNKFGNATKQGALPKPSPAKTLIPSPIPRQRKPTEVDVQAPSATLLFEISCAAGLLGPFTLLELHSESENLPINFYPVNYEKLQSAQLAAGLAMGSISFHSGYPYLQVDTLLHLDPAVAEEDRPAEKRVQAPRTSRRIFSQKLHR